VSLQVTFFNRSYWPDTGATGQLLTELAEDLVARHGMSVTVVTGYPVGRAVHASAREIRNGVRIVRTAGTRWSPTRFVGRALNYLTYFASACWAAVRLPRPDVSIGLTDPPIIGLAAVAARPRHGFVFLCQDVFPEVADVLEFRKPLIFGALEWFSRWEVRRADAIIALGEVMRQRLVDKGANPSRITIIHNWADTAAIVPSEKRNAFSEAHGLADRTVVLHAGNIGLGQNLDVVLDAAERLRPRTDILILFIGDGTRRAALQVAAAARGLENVRFLPFQPRDQLRWTYASSDLCLVSLKPGLSGLIVPSKLYPILAAGRPYIAAVDAGSEAALVTERHRCGIVVPPGDPEALASAITRLSDDAAARRELGVRARAASASYARDRQVAAYAETIARVGASAW
jgi:glycosyltransferase involved in cell wall biosynthesis